MSEPVISIITPTYNRAYILPRAIESVRAQSYENWEMVIMDDGSSDETKTLVLGYDDKRIRYAYQSNKGHQTAKNNAMELSRGQWFVYLDSDNVLRSEHLKTMLSFIHTHPYALWGFPRGTRFLELYKNGVCVASIDDSQDFPETVSVQDIAHRKLHTDMNGAFHARKIYEDGVRFDTHLMFDDWDLFLTLCEKYPPEAFLYIPKVLYDYTQRYGGDGIVSNAGYRTWAKQFEYIFNKHKNDRLMEGQLWHPSRVIKWNKLADDFEKGLIPPYQEYYFWKKS